MLRQRVITALILAGALIAALLFAPYPAQAMLFAAVAAAGGWERGWWFHIFLSAGNHTLLI